MNYLIYLIIYNIPIEGYLFFTQVEAPMTPHFNFEGAKLVLIFQITNMRSKKTLFQALLLYKIPIYKVIYPLFGILFDEERNYY
jgi:hypothetical protein